VLVVDDDELLRDALTDALELCGYDVRTVSDGRSALAAFGDGFDLVVLDIDLPGMDGVEVCRELKRRAPLVPVIFLTGQTETGSKVRALEIGDEHCTKPIDVDELDARIRLLLRMRDRERKLVEAARVDPLTHLGNRRAFEDALERAWSRRRRTGGALALLAGDLDHFKRTNDRFGHPVGDEVLRRVGAAIARTVRKDDEAFRVGGEEFTVVAPHTSPLGGLVLAERVRRAVELVVIEVAGTRVLATLSLGVAAFPADGIDSAEALVAAADRALYDAKEGGRNRVSGYARSST
jgi:diguanylate cyclase (GGDEF)-like protein